MTEHIPVLLNEVIKNLNLKLGEVVLDGTLGGGSYSEQLCKAVGKKGTVIGLDHDKEAIAMVEKKLKDCGCKKYLINENFRNLDKVLKTLKIRKVNAITLDLGLSSDQLKNSGRGFSFQKDEPLVMTLSCDSDKVDFTARDIVNDWEENNIADVLFGYGEEKYSRRIAKLIVEARQEKSIETTFELIKIISDAVPVKYRKGRTHFATKTFQALRITVNDELGSLKDGLSKGFDALDEGGRMAVVSFHSLEDRIVKNFIRDKKKGGEGMPIIKKPITPSREEVLNNPKSRSAKLRVIEKN